MTKQTKQRASADVGYIFTAYNLRRIFNILGHDKLKKYLKGLIFDFFAYLNNFKAIYAFIISYIKIINTEKYLKKSLKNQNNIVFLKKND